MSLRSKKIKIIQFFRRIKNFKDARVRERFFCPVRIGWPKSFIAFLNKDKWIIEVNGDLCCSYCGSCHTEQFLDYCKSVIENNLQLKLEYINCKEVKNASYGVIKFHEYHLRDYLKYKSKEENDRIIDLVNEAIKVSNKKSNICCKKVLKD